jgi:hypothetical protein
MLAGGAADLPGGSRGSDVDRRAGGQAQNDHSVALQVEFERQTLKPDFHLIGFRIWVRKAIGYEIWVNLIQPAEPHHGKRAVVVSRRALHVQRAVALQVVVI